MMAPQVIRELAQSTKSSERAERATVCTVHLPNVVVLNFCHESMNFLLQGIVDDVLESDLALVVDHEAGLCWLFALVIVVRTCTALLII
jgi:hypothetical protein